ncbi:hypothetical protein VKT23_016920 [Stygiomarasmius scandens]|uniref:F-box domain-containing protein n=1 Tax=Marasmiellus scandens TaxID=2682957 RepID=A0ABR1IWM7_9AGAR
MTTSVDQGPQTLFSSLKNEVRYCGVAVSDMRRAQLSCLQSSRVQAVLDIDRKIADYKRSVFSLEHQKAQLGVELAFLKSIRSPIRRLPVEVLNIIFRMSIALSCCEDGSIKTASTCGAFHAIELSQVCTSWYNIVTRDRFLWTDVLLKGVWIVEDSDERCYQSLTMILGRSRGLPLHVHFTGSSTAVTFHPRSVDLLVESSSRWQSLSLYDMDEIHSDYLFSRINTDSLRSINIFSTSTHASADLSFLNLSNTVTHLRIFSHSGSYSSTWPCVVELVMGELGGEDISIDVLPLCPGLETLELRMGGKGSHYPNLTHPNLNTLKIMACNDSSFDPLVLFHASDLPMLNRLCLSNCWLRWNSAGVLNWTRVIRSLVSKSSCQLTFLRVDNVYGTSRGFKDFLNSLPELRELEFVAARSWHAVQPECYDSLFGQLTFPRFVHRGTPKSVLCKKLKALSLEVDFTLITDRTLLDLLVSRVMVSEHLRILLRPLRVGTVLETEGFQERYPADVVDSVVYFTCGEVSIVVIVCKFHPLHGILCSPTAMGTTFMTLRGVYCLFPRKILGSRRNLSLRARLCQSDWFKAEERQFNNIGFSLDPSPSFRDTATGELAPLPRYVGDDFCCVVSFGPVASYFLSTGIEVEITTCQFTPVYLNISHTPSVELRYYKRFTMNLKPFTDPLTSTDDRQGLLFPGTNTELQTGDSLFDVALTIKVAHEGYRYLRHLLCDSLYKVFRRNRWNSVTAVPSALAVATTIRYLFALFRSLPNESIPSTRARLSFGADEVGAALIQLDVRLPGFGRPNTSIFTPCFGRLNRPTHPVIERLSMDLWENNIHVNCTFDRALRPEQKPGGILVVST